MAKNTDTGQTVNSLQKELERLNTNLSNLNSKLTNVNNTDGATNNVFDDLKNPVTRNTAASKVIGVAKNISDIVFNVLETNIKKQTIKLQAASELQTRAIQTYGKALNNALAVQASNVTGNVLDTAYQSLNAVIEGGRSLYMKSLSDAITYRKRENELYKANTQMIAGIGESVGGAMAAFGGTVGLIGSALNAIASLGKRAAMLRAAQTELEIQQYEEIRKNQDEWLQQIEGVVKTFSDMSKQVSKSFLEAGNSAYVYARTLGLGGNSLKLFQDRLIEGVNVELSKFAMDFNDYVKMTTSYEGANGGRNGILATREAMMLGGLSKRLGIGAEEAASITGSMNVFNTSIADGSDMIYQMSKMANRMGLSATKFAKDLEKNLKLAERYQFRGGVKGMMEMALWAQKMRFNIDEMTSLQEKMLSGNIEDVMQTSARLNVLGGNAALFSDPMSMLFNGINNPSGLAKSLNNMIKGYGRFDEKTGETIFNSVEMLRMNAIAQATGMSRENLMDQARQANKRARISQLYGRKFGEEKTDFLTQHATWSKEKNDWIIKVNAPNEKEGFVEKTLSELSGANDEALNNIFPEDKQDRLIDYVQDIRNFLSPGEQQAYADKYGIAATMGAVNRRGLSKTMIDMANEKIGFTNTNADKNAEMVKQFNDAALAAQKKMNMFISEGNANSLVESYLKFTSAQNEELLKQTKDFVASGQSIEEKLETIKTAILGIKSVQDENGKITKENLSGFNKKMYKEEDLKNIISQMQVSIEDDMGNEIKTRKLRDVEINNLIKKIYEGVYTIEDNKVKFINRRGKLSDYPLSQSYDDRGNMFANDAIITPRGTVYTHPEDMIAAFKPNGDFMRGMGSQTNKLEVSGTLRLESNGQSIDLIELVRSNPESLRRLTEEVLITADRNRYGGRSKHAPNRFTIS